jgi:hypothetical protein
LTKVKLSAEAPILSARQSAAANPQQSSRDDEGSHQRHGDQHLHHTEVKRT